MLDEKQKLVEDVQSGDTELASGFIDREYRKVCSAFERVQDMIPSIKYPILNFLRGAVTTDRLHHETAARNGGLNHWCNSSSTPRQEDKGFLHNCGVDLLDYDQHAPQAANMYAAAARSPGMGLEGENFQSFLTGSHHVTVPPVADKTSDNIFPVQTAAPEAAPQPVADEQIQNAPLTLARGPVYRYRSKASATYTDLPPLAVNQ